MIQGAAAKDMIMMTKHPYVGCSIVRLVGNLADVTIVGVKK
ncbi:hypothetical protein [Rossellomorea aquimaris]|nr:hypothetical protein [Rossellomorea aquimaris]